MTSEIGPPSAPPKGDYTDFTTPSYIRGYAKKMAYDLERLFRIYTGKLARFYRIDSSGQRCQTCTDAITGAKLLSKCPECNGTGYTAQYVLLGEFWTLPDFSARVKMGSETGNRINPATGRDSIYVVRAPLLQDSDVLIYVESKEAYAIDNVEPRIVAMGGEIVTQYLQVAYLPPGSREYKLVDW